MVELKKDLSLLECSLGKLWLFDLVFVDCLHGIIFLRLGSWMLDQVDFGKCTTANDWTYAPILVVEVLRPIFHYRLPVHISVCVMFQLQVFHQINSVWVLSIIQESYSVILFFNYWSSFTFLRFGFILFFEIRHIQCLGLVTAAISVTHVINSINLL